MDSKTLMPGVRPKEVWAWSAFDFANSGYTTVVLTAVFNAYFVAVVAGDAPWATFAWTLIIAASNAASLILMPVIGAIADATGKRSGSLRQPSAPSPALSDLPSADRGRFFSPRSW